MRRRDLALLPLLLALPAMSAGAEEPKVDTGQYVDISPVALPVAVNNKLINYVFVSVRVNLTNGADAIKLRDKEPFLRDALVRSGHRSPFTLATDYTRLDEGRLKAALWPDAVSILGRGNVVGIVVTSQTPKQRTGIPRPPQAGHGIDRP
jgi:hypothetical protein